MPAGLVFAIFLVSKMDYKIIKMSSVRNWQSERFENKLRTDKPQSYRQKSMILNRHTQQKNDPETLRVFSKQASSYYENQPELDQSQIKVQTNQQSQTQRKSLNSSNSFPSKITTSNKASLRQKRILQRNISIKENRNKQPEMKNLEDIEVGYKQIQEYHDQKHRQEQARQFVLRLQREKRQFEGRIYLLKRQQQQKKKRAYYESLASKIEEKQIKKIKRMSQIQKRLEQFKNKSIQRQETVRRQRAFSVDKKLSKIKLKLDKYKQQEKIRVQSPTYRLGKKYLQQSGKIKKRVKTQSTQYYDLTEQQREQLDRIRQKIDMLTKSMKK